MNKSFGDSCLFLRRNGIGTIDELGPTVHLIGDSVVQLIYAVKY